MKFRALALYVLVAAIAPVACSTSPTAPAGSLTVMSPSPLTPANGAQIANSAQPVTLTIANGATTDPGAFVKYTFEVASDSAFTNKVQSKDVPQGTGQTTVKLDVLPAGSDYYWHARTTTGDTVGTFSAPLKFTIGPAVVVQAPINASPASGATVASARPTLVINNAVRTGPAGSISYKFEVATDASFSTIVASGTVAEVSGSSQTSFTPPSNLAYKKLHYWHAQAIEASNSITTPFSAASAFTTPNDPNDIWPGNVPPGTNGHAIKGDNWQEQDLVSNGGTPFHSPTLEMKRLFDLFDKGFDPQGAIDWMNANGYPTDAAWYPNVRVIGVKYVYLALINGRWDVVLRQEGD